MLNNFCFHVYAQNSLFIGENDNEFFLTAAAAREFGVHGAGSQLNIKSLGRPLTECTTRTLHCTGVAVVL